MRSELEHRIELVKERDDLHVENQRLRLENARLESQIRWTIEELGKAIYPYRLEFVIEKLSQSPSTALAEFLGPTIEVLKEVEKEISVYLDKEDWSGWLLEVQIELRRLTSAIGGDK